MSSTNEKMVDVPHVEIHKTDYRKINLCDVRGGGISEAARFLRSILGGKEQESFIILILNSRGHVTAWREVARGYQDRVDVPVRELFRTAILCDAAGIICAHNHPSGDPTPSTADMVVTAQLKVGGDSIGIPIVDHIIIGEGERYYSFSLGHQSTKPAAIHGDREPPDL
jgi:DNA repair protein RadC